MNCVFCCKLVPNWEDSENSLRKPALQNPSLFDFFCRQLGIEIDESTISSLDKVPNCEECYLIYDELQIVYIQLEDLKCEVDRHVGELKRRVFDSNADNDMVGHIFSNTSPTDVGPIVLQFRKQIIKAKKPRGAVSDVLASCSGFSGIVKSEQQEIKLEPLDIDMGSYSDSIDDNDEFEIHPQGDKQDDKDSLAGNDGDYMDTYDAHSENVLSERKTRSKRTRESKKFKKEEVPVERKRKPRSSVSSKTAESKKSDAGPSRVRKTKSETPIRKRRSRAVKKVAKLPDKPRAKRMIISSDESEDETGADENQGKLLSNSKNKLPCPICGKFFPKPSKLQRHHLIVHEKQRPFNCTLCEKSFARKHAFIMHLINSHEIEDDKPLACPDCGKKYTLQILLDRHVAFHKLDSTKPLKCEICEVRFPVGKTDLVERHMQLTHTKRPNSFHCEQCNISFQNRNLLLKHDLQFHTDKFIYKCDVCDKRYSVQELLDTHILTHSTKGPYQCTVCKWEVLTADLLTEHLLSHTGEKRLKCKDCDERFFSLAELKRHGVHVHGAEKPFECKFCKNKYILNSDRTAHVREVHTGFPNQFKCEICGKGFSNKKYLSNHIKKIHEFQNVVICAICGKRLAGPSSLRDHMNSHEGIKPFECTYCGKRFVKKNSLKCHVMIHTGEKPFVCEICGKAYNQSHCLKSHLKSHSNTKATLPSISTAASNDSSSNSAISVSQPHPHIPHPSTLNPVYSIAEHISYASFYQNL